MPLPTSAISPLRSPRPLAVTSSSPTSEEAAGEEPDPLIVVEHVADLLSNRLAQPAVSLVDYYPIIMATRARFPAGAGR